MNYYDILLRHYYDIYCDKLLAKFNYKNNNVLPDRRELDKIVFEALGLTEDEQPEVYRAVVYPVK